MVRRDSLWKHATALAGTSLRILAATKAKMAPCKGRENPMLNTIVGLIFGYMLIASMPLMGQDDCKVVLDAMTKAIDTPNHTYTTTNMSGVTQAVESISTGGTIYAKVNGKWSAGTTTKEMKAITEKNRQTNKPTCRYLNDEPVNGEMAAV